MTRSRDRVARIKQVKDAGSVACFARERLRTPRCAGHRRPPFHFSKHLTPSTVIAFAALVFALTGGAFAATGGPGAGGNSHNGSHATLTASAAKAKAAPKGKAGPRGPAGAKGATGATGPAGAAGTAGPAGPAGPTGPAGVGTPGAPGTQGIQGIQGIQGEKGPPGTTGFTKTLPSGESEHGTWAVSALPGSSELGESAATSISFPIALAEGSEAVIVPPETPEANDPAGCAGTVAEPHAEPGKLCIFVNIERNVLKNGEKPILSVLTPETVPLSEGAGPAGAVMLIPAEKPGTIVAFGAWVVTAK
jgi:hypothetical protein